jgi:hypothetical protein
MRLDVQEVATDVRTLKKTIEELDKQLAMPVGEADKKTLLDSLQMYSYELHLFNTTGQVYRPETRNRKLFDERVETTRRFWTNVADGGLVDSDARQFELVYGHLFCVFAEVAVGDTERMMRMLLLAARYTFETGYVPLGIPREAPLSVNETPDKLFVVATFWPHTIERKDVKELVPLIHDHHSLAALEVVYQAVRTPKAPYFFAIFFNWFTTNRKPLPPPVALLALRICNRVNHGLPPQSFVPAILDTLEHVPITPLLKDILHVAYKHMVTPFLPQNNDQLVRIIDRFGSSSIYWQGAHKESLFKCVEHFAVTRMSRAPAVRYFWMRRHPEDEMAKTCHAMLTIVAQHYKGTTSMVRILPVDVWRSLYRFLEHDMFIQTL